MQSISVPPFLRNHNNDITLTLTDDDLRALGLIIANWAIAESIMHSTLLQFYTHPAVAITEYPKINIYAFQRKRETWKKVVRIICKDPSEYLDLGIFLASHGKKLKYMRDQAAHWPATRTVTKPNGKLHFSNLTTPSTDNKIKTESFTTESLLELSHDIVLWGIALGRYCIMVSFDLLTPSPRTLVGETPDRMLEALRNYRKTVQSHQNPTNPKSSSLPPTSHK